MKKMLNFLFFIFISIQLSGNNNITQKDLSQFQNAIEKSFKEEDIQGAIAPYTEDDEVINPWQKTLNSYIESKKLTKDEVAVILNNIVQKYHENKLDENSLKVLDIAISQFSNYHNKNSIDLLKKLIKIKEKEDIQQSAIISYININKDKGIDFLKKEYNNIQDPFVISSCYIDILFDKKFLPKHNQEKIITFLEFIIFQKKNFDCALEVDTEFSEIFPLYKKSLLRKRIARFVLKNMPKNGEYLSKHFSPISKRLNLLKESELNKDFLKKGPK